MFNLQGSEIIVILLLALVVLGPEKLPDAVRRFTQTYNEIKKMGAGFQSELKSALDEPMREMRETADMVRDAADPDRIAASVDADRARAKSAPGDPPLVDHEATEPQAAADAVADQALAEASADEGPVSGSGPPNVNRIAAANASGAIEAARATEAGGADPADESADDPADESAVDRAALGEADRVVSGPAFHSAAPRAAPASAPGRDGDDAAVEADDADDGADGPADRQDVEGSVESSDETATA